MTKEKLKAFEYLIKATWQWSIPYELNVFCKDECLKHKYIKWAKYSFKCFMAQKKLLKSVIWNISFIFPYFYIRENNKNISCILLKNVLYIINHFENFCYANVSHNKMDFRKYILSLSNTWLYFWHIQNCRCLGYFWYASI